MLFDVVQKKRDQHHILKCSVEELPEAALWKKALTGEGEAPTGGVSSAFGEFQSLEQFSRLRKHKANMENADTVLLPLMGITFPTEVNLCCEGIPEAADSKVSTEFNWKHTVVPRRAFPGAGNRFPSRSFHTFIPSKILLCNIDLFWLSSLILRFLS